LHLCLTLLAFCVDKSDWNFAESSVNVTIFLRRDLCDTGSHYIQFPTTSQILSLYLFICTLQCDIAVLLVSWYFLTFVLSEIVLTVIYILWKKRLTVVNKLGIIETGNFVKWVIFMTIRCSYWDHNQIWCSHLRMLRLFYFQDIKNYFGVYCCMHGLLNSTQV